MIRSFIFSDGKLVGQASGTVFGDNAFVVTPGGGARPQFFLQLRDATGAVFGDATLQGPVRANSTTDGGYRLGPGGNWPGCGT